MSRLLPPVHSTVRAALQEEAAVECEVLLLQQPHADDNDDRDAASLAEQPLPSAAVASFNASGGKAVLRRWTGRRREMPAAAAAAQAQGGAGKALNSTGQAPFEVQLTERAEA